MADQVAPVALVLVSHSRALAEGTAQVAAQMAPGVLIVPAGGTDDDGLGTSFDRVDAALGEATAGGRGAVVLTDLGSAVLTTESVLELADPEVATRVRIADAPFVEGAVAAAVTAHGGADLATVLDSAQAAGTTFGAPQVPGRGSGDAAAPTAPDGAAHATVTLRNPLGLHARPAALIVRMLASFDAKVQVDGVNAASVLDLMKLGAVKGDVLTITAQGPQASEAVERLVADVESGFGELPPA
ncbi:dihydroxyacetone kinase phosphoryl donor subunit DhaM [Cellulomonas wangsupingiae]|uniref:Phosphocarrier protein HPr n=1 Tax=Cellulomonas wangsupingiae TaxID=2968085 RepID=A0ABY5K7V1_9CELL|nr:dihydroxyacetone kinase phosphoryl donor subunit DhaM [Cellulomonas wangsupingiae]MCC2335326.1 PTS-dependent dihydroxyacetone kinase phosphotransferase subunit DhaM [Cellulomonas wangsupingiae]MCM0639053.1 dihydroxyacetone kinase phosphoryl donor subunit DhaM [Cellulomonas wangsupingiae]UUI66537.1 dihydroxyacetone kinase phosphoryl donor subunit DhaM [Cellulomonas wangsupingiae]